LNQEDRKAEYALGLDRCAFPNNRSGTRCADLRCRTAAFDCAQTASEVML